MRNLHITQTHVLFKNHPQKTPQDTQKWFQILSKSSPRDHLRAKNHSDCAQTRKKSILGGWVPHHARQKRPKLTPQTTPKKLKMKTSYYVPRNIHVGYCFEPPKRAFGYQNTSLWDTCWRLWTIGSKPSIFEGCTVRFACFCNTRRLVFAPQNTLKRDFFTYLTESSSETRKKGPRTLRKEPQNSPLEPPDAPKKHSRNWTPKKVTFCAGN